MKTIKKLQDAQKDFDNEVSAMEGRFSSMSTQCALLEKKRENLLTDVALLDAQSKSVKESIQIERKEEIERIEARAKAVDDQRVKNNEESVRLRSENSLLQSGKAEVQRLTAKAEEAMKLAKAKEALFNEKLKQMGALAVHNGI